VTRPIIETQPIDSFSNRRSAVQQPSSSIPLRHYLWLALIVVASVAFTLGFACAVPLAAFGAVAALTLSRRDALLLIGAVWLANQTVGFAALGYPWTADTFAWGAILGVVGVLATLAAQQAARRLEGTGQVARSCGAFVAAFAAYEAALFGAAVSAMGGTEDFTPAIVGEILTINAAAFVGLLLLNRLGAIAGLGAKPDLRVPVVGARLGIWSPSSRRSCHNNACRDRRSDQNTASPTHGVRTEWLRGSRRA
jgi:hypothetical protein